jgi:hypothetical protein
MYPWMAVERRINDRGLFSKLGDGLAEHVPSSVNLRWRPGDRQAALLV